MYYSCYIIVIVIYCATVGRTARAAGYVFNQKAGGSLKLHDPSTWLEAKEKCFLEGAVLASPENEEILMAMADGMTEGSDKNITKIFTGIHNTYSHQFLYTLEGTPMASLPVPLAQNLNQEHYTYIPSTDTCLSMHQNGILNFNDCIDYLPYFCFKKLRRGGEEDGVSNKCEIGYKYEDLTRKCYKFHTEARMWSEAFAICSEEGGHLAVINGDTEAEVLESVYAHAEYETGYPDEIAFIGFTELGNHENRLWMTIHGESLEKAGYSRWGWSGYEWQPHTIDGHCGAMFNTGLLDDFFCSSYRGFICEKTPIKAQAVQLGNDNE